jgi:hypothetical protein
MCERTPTGRLLQDDRLVRRMRPLLCTFNHEVGVRNAGATASKFMLLLLAILLLTCSAFGCQGGLVGESGPLERCGNHCTAADVSASCQATCNKISQAACAGAQTSDCVQGCTDMAATGAACAPLAYSYLRCVEPMQPSCSDAGILQFAACNAEWQSLEACGVDAGTVRTGPGGGAGVPPDVCPDIPRPPVGAPLTCGGGGGGGAVAGGATCMSSCQDSAGNVWAADCAGAACTCSYNGGQACTCTILQDSGCRSCCPGT